MVANLSENSCRLASNSPKQSREIVNRFCFCSTESSFMTVLVEILESPNSIIIMFCVRSYKIPTVSAISLIFNDNDFL